MKRSLCILLFLALTLAACGETAAPTTTTIGITPTAQATQAPTATPTHALTWKTVQTITGNGSKKTGLFQAPDDWKILWSCVGGDYGGYLAVTVYGPDNGYIDGAVNATCKTGQAPTTGETEEHAGGSVYLSVDGTGDWSLQVQELK